MTTSLWRSRIAAVAQGRRHRLAARRAEWRTRLGVLGTLVVLALPASAAIFDDDEARKRIAETNVRLEKIQRDLDERITAIETQLKSQGLVDLFKSVEALKADVAKLRGQIEVVLYEQEQTGKRQRDLYVDLDSRLRKLEAGPAVAADAGAPGGGATAATGATAADPGAEQRAYDAALDQFKGGNYAVAIGAFGAFVKAYPKSALAPSAQYWIGNAQFAQKEYRAAIAAQRLLIATYPDSPKVPDALLNIASSQFELGEGPASRRTLEEVVAKYPQSEAAVKAKQRLSNR